jgi:two-component system CheB/CheR fusion protein
VVGIGASAGGLEALERFFEHVPSDSRIAWIVVQHLSPDHKSLMAEILGKRTQMPVKEVVEDEELKPGHVYLGPARSLVAVDGKTMRLKLRDRASGLNLPIDALFRSMAEHLEEDAVGVVLSGTGSDGRSGLEAIKDAGGLVVAQDPTTARFDGMPLSAVSTGLVDLVLPPEAMPDQIARVLEDGFARTTGALPPGDALDTIFAALKKVSGIDFSEYKSSTVGRRIERRMGMLGLTSLEEYSRRVAESSAEALLLSRELLINVTRFFRDEPAFEVLKATAVEALVRRAQPGDVLRVWVAGCSTGQEAYTVGMILAEACAERTGVDFKIFATDIDRAALDVAGAGVYSDALVGELTHERLTRFFARRGEDWQVTSELRRHIVFAPHNLTRDPPFTRLDLVTCRNVLIYLSPNVQKRVLAAISFAVKPDAFLMLGTSETLGDLSDRYRAVDQQWRICQRLPTGRSFLDATGSTVFSSTSRGLDASSPTTPQQVIESAFRVLIDRVSQAAVLVNQSLAVVAVFGNAETVLKVPLGAASLSVLAMLPPELRSPVTVAFHRANAGDGEAVATVADAGDYGVASVRCIPIAAGRSPDRFVIIVFERPHESRHDGAEVVLAPSGSAGQVTELQQELQLVRDRLQSAVEQLETSNEELQAANEELLAANEELQSTNEELQSVNEELNTVNAEHREKIRDLTDLNADLDNMFKSSTVGTVFLDEQLTIRRFTPALAGQFNVLDRDLGRPITDLSSKFLDASFIGDLQAVVEVGGQREREVRTIDGRTYLMRITPFLSDARQILGAVVTFADITVLRQAEGTLQGLQRILDSLPEHVAVLDGQGDIRVVNRAWTRFAEANGPRSLSGLGIGVNYLAASASEPEVRRGLEEVLAGRLPGFQHEYPCHSPTTRRWFRLYVAPLEGDAGAVVSHVDITSRVETDPDARVQAYQVPES